MRRCVSQCTGPGPALCMACGVAVGQSAPHNMQRCRPRALLELVSLSVLVCVDRPRASGVCSFCRLWPLCPRLLSPVNPDLSSLWRSDGRAPSVPRARCPADGGRRARVPGARRGRRPRAFVACVVTHLLPISRPLGVGPAPKITRAALKATVDRGAGVCVSSRWGRCTLHARGDQWTMRRRCQIADVSSVLRPGRGPLGILPTRSTHG